MSRGVWVPAFAGTTQADSKSQTTANTPSRSRGLIHPSFAIYFPPSPIRGRRECRAPDAPAASCALCIGRTHTSNNEYTGNTRHSPRNGFNGFLRALPGDRALLPPSSAVARQLDTSVGASGPHDFAVRFSAVRQERIRVHRIPPRVRDDREPPLCGTGRGELVEMICPTGKAEYFCKGGWTGKSLICPSGKSNSPSGNRS